MPAGECSEGSSATATAASGREEEELAVQEGKKRRRRLVDRPAVAWLLENACIISMAACRCLVPTGPEGLSAWQHLLAIPAGGVVLIDGMILVQMLLVHRVYAHIPFLSEGSERTGVNLRAALRDWLLCNLPTYLLGGLLERRASRRQALAASVARTGRPGIAGLLRLVPSFLAKLAVARLAADLAFYASHRALHTRVLYGWVHKRHHEHKAPALATNFHFTIPDLLLEGTFPLMVALAAVRRVWGAVPTSERILLAAYIQWYEIGSHAGKAIPVVSYLPPIAPLYRWLFGDLDANNVQFHSDHHAHTNCNYGITQWLDHVLRTARNSRRPPATRTDRAAGAGAGAEKGPGAAAGVAAAADGEVEEGDEEKVAEEEFVLIQLEESGK